MKTKTLNKLVISSSIIIVIFIFLFYTGMLQDIIGVVTTSPGGGGGGGGPITATCSYSLQEQGDSITTDGTCPNIFNAANSNYNDFYNHTGPCWNNNLSVIYYNIPSSAVGANLTLKIKAGTSAELNPWHPGQMYYFPLPNSCIYNNQISLRYSLMYYTSSKMWYVITCNTASGWQLLPNLNSNITLSNYPSLNGMAVGSLFYEEAINWKICWCPTGYSLHGEECWKN